MMSRSWREQDEILGAFRDWLSQTAEELDALDDDPTVAFSVDTGGNAARSAPEAGLLPVAEALTAMRHELKLQTKGSRTLEESVHVARQGLATAIRQFQSVQAREAQSAERAALPLVEAMAGLDEAVRRTGHALKAAHRQVRESVEQQVREVLAKEVRRLPWWRRWLVGNWRRRIEPQLVAAGNHACDEHLDHMIEGYRLLQERNLQQLERHDLRRIETVGHPVDPGCMTVVALADPQEGPPETVVEEVRPGYRWRDKVIRFAEVQAVPSRREAPSAAEPINTEPILSD